MEPSSLLRVLGTGDGKSSKLRKSDTYMVSVVVTTCRRWLSVHVNPVGVAGLRYVVAVRYNARGAVAWGRCGNRVSPPFSWRVKPPYLTRRVIYTPENWTRFVRDSFILCAGICSRNTIFIFFLKRKNLPVTYVEFSLFR